MECEFIVCIGIFDGQHRVAALYLLAQRNMWNSNDRNILVEVFTVRDEVSDIFPIFKEINSAEPVSMIDLINEDEEELAVVHVPSSVVSLDSVNTNELAVPITDALIPNDVSEVRSQDTIAVEKVTANVEITVRKDLHDARSNKSDVVPSVGVNAASPPETKILLSLSHKQIKNIIDKTCKHFQANYQVMFKPSKQCKIPHLNIDNMRETLYESNLVHKFPNELELIQHIEQINATLALRSEQEWLKTQDNYSDRSKLDALYKSQSNKFYLGMERNWVNLITDRVNQS